MVLTKKEYEIIKKHIIDDVPVEQLAQKMGTSRQAVNQSKNRALNKLRMLYQHMEEEKAQPNAMPSPYDYVGFEYAVPESITDPLLLYTFTITFVRYI